MHTPISGKEITKNYPYWSWLMSTFTKWSSVSDYCNTTAANGISLGLGSLVKAGYLPSHDQSDMVKSCQVTPFTCVIWNFNCFAIKLQPSFSFWASWRQKAILRFVYHVKIQGSMQINVYRHVHVCYRRRLKLSYARLDSLSLIMTNTTRRCACRIDFFYHPIFNQYYF